MMMYHQTKFAYKKVSSSEDRIETIIFISDLAVTLTLKMQNNVYTTLWIMMMHHHTQFGYKSLNRSEDIQLRLCTLKPSLVRKVLAVQKI